MKKNRLNKIKVDESFRELKNNIKFPPSGKIYKLIAITSSKLGEGKSFIASRLAITLSKEDNKILLVDCDSENKKIHKILNLSNVIGLSDILSNEDQENILIEKYSENIDVITAGNTHINMLNKTVLNRLDDILEKIIENYEYIIFNIPSILEEDNWQGVISKVDGTILVVGCNGTTKNEVNNSYKKLKESNNDLIGVVLNKASI